MIRQTKRRVLACLAASALALIGSSARASTLVTPGDEASIQNDVQYGIATGVNLLMDVFLPRGSGPFPALVAVHGGGFFQGDKSLMRGVAKFFADNGYAVFSIDYRLAPDYPYPAAVDDAQTAVRFVRDHAADYKVDPTRIGMIGGSAGATISASVAAASKGNFDTGSGVAAAACWSAALDLSTVFEERKNNVEVKIGIPGYIGMPGGDMFSPEAQAKLKEASPYYQIQKGAPPMYIANSIVEFIPLDQAQTFVKKLRDLDIPHEFLTPASGHALKYAGQAERPTLEFFDKYVRDFVSPLATQPTIVPGPSGATGAPPSKKNTPLFVGMVATGVGLVLVMVLWPIARSKHRNRAWR
jgi:acetyl esterase